MLGCMVRSVLGSSLPILRCSSLRRKLDRVDSEEDFVIITQPCSKMDDCYSYIDQSARTVTFKLVGSSDWLRFFCSRCAFALRCVYFVKKEGSIGGGSLFIYLLLPRVCVFGSEFRKIKRNMFCLSLIILRGLLTGQACEVAGNADSSVISTNRFCWVGFFMRRVILGIWRPVQ